MAITNYEEIEKLDRHEADYMKAGRETIACVTPEMRIWFRDTFGHMDYDYRIKEEWMKAHETLAVTQPQYGVDISINNGGSTDYYKFKPSWNECGDIIEDRNMNYNQGNIFKSAFCFNIGRHEGTDYVRELNKIIYFAQRELDRVREEERRHANTN